MIMPGCAPTRAREDSAHGGCDLDDVAHEMQRRHAAERCCLRPCFLCTRSTDSS